MWRRFRELPRGAQYAIWAFVVILVIGAIGSAAEDEPDEQVTSGQATTTAAAEEPEPTAAAPTTTVRATTTTTEPGPKTTFGDGTHRVGTDIAAGTYRSNGGSGCYWERVRGFGGSFGEIIANGNGNAGQQLVVTIAASDAGFTSRRCGTWTAA